MDPDTSGSLARFGDGAAKALEPEALVRFKEERGDAMLPQAMGNAHDGQGAAVDPETELDDDPALTAELGRRLDALLRGEARTVSRAEMKERLARLRASRSST